MASFDDLGLSTSIDQEINDSIDSLLNNFLYIHKNNNHNTVDTDSFRNILFRIHSLKCSLILIELKDISKSLHQLESFLSKSFEKTGCTEGVCDIAIDYLSKMRKALNTETDDIRLLTNFEHCYNCLENNNYQSVCPSHHLYDQICNPNQESEKFLDIFESAVNTFLKLDSIQFEDVAIIGENPLVKILLNESNLTFRSYNCINQFYRKGHNLKGVKLVISDLSNSEINPFYLQNIIRSFSGDTKFCYVVDNQRELINCLMEVKLDHFNFIVISKQSEKYIDDILNVLKFISAEKEASQYDRDNEYADRRAY
jgi:hypothetical protein